MRPGLEWPLLRVSQAAQVQGRASSPALFSASEVPDHRNHLGISLAGLGEFEIQRPIIAKAFQLAQQKLPINGSVPGRAMAVGDSVRVVEMRVPEPVSEPAEQLGEVLVDRARRWADKLDGGDRR